MTRPAPAPGRPARRLAAGARRGAVLPLVCLLLAVILGCAALALDLGRMYHTATEAQATADAAALAAARELQMNPGDATSAVPAAAARIAAANRVAAANGVVPASEVAPELHKPSDGSVTAVGTWGQANTVRAGAVANHTYLFGRRTAGAASTSLTRRSRAWIGNVNGMSCLKPISMPYSDLYNLMVHEKLNEPNQGAAEYTQLDMKTIADRGNDKRTIVLLPWPKRRDADGGTITKFHSWWMPVDFTGLNSTAEMQTWLAGGNCPTAKAVVGQTLSPYQMPASDYAAAMAKGLEPLCHFLPGDARCRLAPQSIKIAPRVRVLLTDDMPLPGQAMRRGWERPPAPGLLGNGYPPQRVRGVAVARIICYFRTKDDTCLNIIDYHEPLLQYTGYPVGTMLVLVEPLRGVDLAPDVILGDKVSYNQRLVLVK